MPNGGSGFFGGLLGGIGEGLSVAASKKFEKEQHAKDELSRVYLGAISAGADPNVIFPKLAEMWAPAIEAMSGGSGKGKGKSKGPLAALHDPEVLGSLMAGLHKSITGGEDRGAAGGSETTMPDTKPSSPFGHIPTEQERAETEIQNRGKTVAAEVEARATAELGVAQKAVDGGKFKSLDQAFSALFGRRGPVSGIKVLPGVMTSEEVAKADPNAKGLNGEKLTTEPGMAWQRVEVPTDDGTEIRYVAGPKPKGTALRPEQKRAAQLAEADGKAWESLSEAQQQTYTTLAAKTIEKENAVKRDQAAQRTLAFLASSETTRNLSAARLEELRQSAPLTVEAKQLGIQLDQKRLAEIKSKDPTAVLSQARRIAHALAVANSKRALDSIRTIFGDTTPSEEELTDKTITELSGLDPQTVRDAAAQKIAPSTGETYYDKNGNPIKKPS